MNHSDPPRKMRMSSRAERPLTTETPDAVQPARYLIGVLIELTAGMEVGHDDLGCGHPLLVMNTDRDAAAIIGDRARPVGVQRHRDGVAIACQRLVDRIIDDLINHMMQTGSVIGVADIHPRPLAHRVEPAQHLDRLLVVRRILSIGGAVTGATGGGVRRSCGMPGSTASDAGIFAISSLGYSFRGQENVAAKVPSFTDRNWAWYRSGANSASSVPVSQTWPFEPEQRFEQSRAPAGIEVGSYLVEQEQRGFAADHPAAKWHERAQSRSTTPSARRSRRIRPRFLSRPARRRDRTDADRLSPRQSAHRFAGCRRVRRQTRLRRRVPASRRATPRRCQGASAGRAGTGLRPRRKLGRGAARFRAGPPPRPRLARP